MHKWRLVYKEIMNDKIVKQSCNNIKCVFVGETADKYDTLINTCPYKTMY